VIQENELTCSEFSCSYKENVKQKPPVCSPHREQNDVNVRMLLLASAGIISGMCDVFKFCDNGVK